MAKPRRAYPDGLLKTENDSKAAFVGLFVVLHRVDPRRRQSKRVATMGQLSDSPSGTRPPDQ